MFALQDAISLIRDVSCAEKAAKRLAEEAYQRGSNDNISCVVLKFAFGGASGSGSSKGGTIGTGATGSGSSNGKAVAL